MVTRLLSMRKIALMVMLGAYMLSSSAMVVFSRMQRTETVGLEKIEESNVGVNFSSASYSSTSVKLNGNLTSEDFCQLRDQNRTLEVLDLSGMTNTILPDFAFSGLTSLKEVKLPACCETIGEGAFLNCRNLVMVNLDQVKELRAMALSGTGVAKVIVPATMNQIGDFAFEDCRKLTAIDVDAANASYSSLNGVLFDKQKTTLLEWPTAKAEPMEIPQTVTAIADFSCNHLLLKRTPKFSSGLKTIGNYSFSCSTQMAGKLAFSQNLESVGQNAFWGCNGVNGSLALPENIKVADYSFGYMKNVEEIALPQSLAVLPSGLFSHCTNLKSVKTLREEPATLEDFVFDGFRIAHVCLTVPAGSEDKYRSAEGWSKFYEKAPENEPKRFSVSGKYMIQYIGAGEDKDLYVTHQLVDNTQAKMAPMSEATTWEMNFFKGWGTDEMAFNGGMITDMKFSMPTDDSKYGMMIHSGICYITPKQGYSKQNNNRAFAFWIDDSTGKVAIQSNGVYFRVSKDLKQVTTVKYTGTPRPEDFVFRLVDDGPRRFSRSGKYYIRYIGEGKDKGLCITHNQVYGKKAQMASMSEATIWEMNFFKGWGTDDMAFNGGMITDMKFSLPTDDAKYGLMIHFGVCYTELKSNYSINNNNNRAFAFWVDRKTGKIAIQSNGFYYSSTQDKSEVTTEAYNGLPREKDFAFELVPYQEVYQTESTPVLTLDEIQENKQYVLRNCLNDFDRGDRSGYLTMEDNIVNVLQGLTSLSSKSIFTIHKNAEGGYSFKNNDQYIPNVGNQSTALVPTEYEGFFKLTPMEGKKGFFTIQSLANKSFLNANPANGDTPGYSVYWNDPVKANPYQIYEVSTLKNSKDQTVVYSYYDATSNIHLSEVTQKLYKGTYPNEQELSAFVPLGFSMTAVDGQHLSDIVTLVKVSSDKTEYIVNVENRVSISKVKYGTLYSEKYALSIPEGVKAYTGKVNKDYTQLVLTPVQTVIPANTPVVLQAEAGEYVFAANDVNADSISDNSLSGSMGNISNPLNNSQSVLTLQYLNNQVGFYKYVGKYMVPFKAYLQIPTTLPASHCIRMVIDAPTGIENNITEEKDSQLIYDCSGRKINKIERPGFYIVNGRKALIMK